MTVFSPIAGWLSDKVKPHKIASFGIFLSFISLLIFTFLKENTSLTLIIISLIILGFGLAFFTSPNTNVIMSSVEKEFYGVASATLATMRLIGQMFSMGISMLILANYLGKIQITPQYFPIFLQAMRIIFSVFSIFCLFGIFFSLLRKKIGGPGGN
jgi:MFS family permease